MSSAIINIGFYLSNFLSVTLLLPIYTELTFGIVSILSSVFRYFSVLQIPTSVSVSVFTNIRYRFGSSVYRPKTSSGCNDVSQCKEVPFVG